MVLFNYSTREITAKIVYYGPGLCGKTTNLQHIFAELDPKSRGKLLSLATDTDRTLFFDFLPLDLGTISGFRVRYQLYTVPGQVHYNATRRMVLKGVDAVVFVADSQVEMMDNNRESFRNLGENLVENGYKFENVPIVLQANKRDLPNIADPEDIVEAIDGGSYQLFEAVASRGDGVFETLKAIIRLATAKLKDELPAGGLEETSLEELAPSPPQKTPAPSYEPKPLVSDDDFLLSDSEEEDDVAAPAQPESDMTELVHDEWEILDESTQTGAPAEEAAPEEKPVEELDIEEFDEGRERPARESRSSPLRPQVEELAREMQLLKAENREIRGMLEKIFLGIGRQIDILKEMHAGFAGEEEMEVPSSDGQSRDEGE